MKILTGLPQPQQLHQRQPSWITITVTWAWEKTTDDASKLKKNKQRKLQFTTQETIFNEFPCFETINEFSCRTDTQGDIITTCLSISACIVMFSPALIHIAVCLCDIFLCILSTVMFPQALEISYPRTDGLYFSSFLLKSVLLSFVQTTKPKP